jgi:hypothetical protein
VTAEYMQEHYLEETEISMHTTDYYAGMTSEHIHEKFIEDLPAGRQEYYEGSE